MKGGCCCGDVRYELCGAIQDVYYCHCRECQILSGSAHHVLGIVARESLHIAGGELSAYSTPAASGFDMTRRFCTRCGTPLFLHSDRFADITMFTVSSLDDPALVRPRFEIWTSSELPWAAIDTAIRSFARGALDG